MKFDWQRFLDSYNIPYVTHSGNLQRGRLGLACPLCAEEGNPDPDYHLGIDPKTGMWNCWRGPRHGGKSPVALIRALLKCSWTRAREIAGNTLDTAEGFKMFELSPQQIFEANHIVETGPKEVTFPDSLKLLDLERKTHKRFANYLLDRGYPIKLQEELSKYYGLRVALAGRWKHRVVFPVYEGNKLISWTGRSIDSDATPRYLSLSASKVDKDGKQAVKNLKELPWNLNNFREGNIIVVCEGPFDALKVDFYGRTHNVTAVCLHGLNISAGQLVALGDVSDLAQKIVVMLDTPDVSQAVAKEMVGFGCYVHTSPIPEGRKDPGELTKKEVKRFCINGCLARF